MRAFPPTYEIPQDSTGSIAMPDFEIHWRQLVDHRTSAKASESLESVHRRFAESDVAYMAVLEEGRVVGLCGRQEIATRLGAQYGYSLFARSAVREHLIPGPLLIVESRHWQDVLQEVFAREGESFHHDVLVTDETGIFLGLIEIQTVIRVQTRLLLQAIHQLQQRRLEIARQNCQMATELAMAREVQRAMLTSDFASIYAKLSSHEHCFRIVSHYEPKGEVSGDFYAVMAPSGSVITAVIADVMGHGVQAALVTAMLRTVIQEHGELAADPAALLTRINTSSCHLLAEISDPLFVSAFVVTLELTSGQLRYANAGHPSPILFRSNDNSVSALDASVEQNGGIMGIQDNWACQTGKFTMDTGDRLMLYTDGLFELYGSNGEMLGTEGLLAIASMAFNGKDALPIVDFVDRIRKHSPHNEFDDDVCILAFELLEHAR